MRTHFDLTHARITLAMAFVFGLLVFANQAEAQRRGGRSVDVFKFLAEKYDRDNDGKLTAEEYDRSKENFKKFDTNRDGVLTAEDWAGGSSGRGRGGRGQRGSSAARGTAPAEGSKAPDFSLTHILDAKKTEKLSSYAGSKPVALLFGSCT